jgi:single-strand DNA-binding protein
MTAQLRQPNLPGQSGVPDSSGRQSPEALPESKQQFLPGGILQFKVTRSQGPEMLQKRLSDTEPDEFGFHGRKNGILTIGSSPFLQNGKLLGFVLQILEDSREEDIDQVLKRNVLLEVGRICRLAQSAVGCYVTNGLVKNPASFVPPEIVGDTTDYLLEVCQEVPVVFQVNAVYRATRSRRPGAALYCCNGGIDKLLTARAGQIPCKARVGSQLSQETLCQPGELSPLLIGYARQRIAHIGIGSISLMLPLSRSFRFHSKTRVWRVSRSGSRRRIEEWTNRKGKNQRIMTDLNYIVLTGRLTRDPVARRGETGVFFAYFTIAANRFYKDKTGAFQQETAFVPCVAFGRSAELISHRLKGEPVIAAGRLRTDVWEQDAEKRSQLTLVCESVRAFTNLAIASPISDQEEDRANGDPVPQEIKNSVPF